MTHKILQSDIELARKQLEAKRSDAEIVAALERRGIEPDKAAQLVQDLREGKPVSPEIDRVPQIVPGPSSEAAQNPGAGLEDAPEIEENFSGRSIRRHGRRRPNPGRNWIIATALLLLVVTAGILGYRLYEDRLEAPEGKNGRPLETQTARAASHSNKAAVQTHAPQLELREDGLRLAGNLIGRSNAQSVITRVFGPATRTNQVERPSKVIYAYDPYGVLVYSQRGGADENIVFDFDALGGTHGTESAFAGSLKVDAAEIRANTDAQSLGAIKSLGLTRSGPDGCIFASRHAAVELVFTYRKGLQRLSSIELDLK